MSQTLGWNISVGSHVPPDFETVSSRPVFRMRLKTEVPCVIMSAMASRITNVSIVWSAVCSGEDQKEHQSFASLALVRGIHNTGDILSNGTQREGIQAHAVLTTFYSEESCLLAHISLWFVCVWWNVTDYQPSETICWLYYTDNVFSVWCDNVAKECADIIN